MEKTTLVKEKIGKLLNPPEKFREVGLEEAKNFLNFQKSFARGMGLGVFLCILSPSLLIGAEGAGALSGILSAAGMVFLLFCVAAAVGLFIYYGMKAKEFADLNEEPFRLEEFTGDYIEKLAEDNEGAFRVQIMAGVIFCIVSILPAVVFDELGLDIPLLENLLMVVLFFLVGIGVFCFVYGGIFKNGFDILLQRGEYKVKKKRKRMNKK